MDFSSRDDRKDGEHNGVGSVGVSKAYVMQGAPLYGTSHDRVWYNMRLLTVFISIYVCCFNTAYVYLYLVILIFFVQ